MAVREGFRSTSGGLRDSFPLRLYGKAKRLGGWDPAAIDLTRDREDWAALGELERALVQIKRDESRHGAYGIFLLSRLVAADAAVDA